jgi:hypothetical protein
VEGQVSFGNVVELALAYLLFVWPSTLTLETFTLGQSDGIIINKMGGRNESEGVGEMVLVLYFGITNATMPNLT